LEHSFKRFLSNPRVVVAQFCEQVSETRRTHLVNFVTVVTSRLGKCLFKQQETSLLHLHDFVLHRPLRQLKPSLHILAS
jgi:hypothetical protein